MSDVIEKFLIQEVIHRYSDAITQRNWTQVAALFTPDATWELVGTQQKFKGDCAGALKGLVEPSNFLVQMTSATAIEVKGDTATSRTTMQEVGEFEPGRMAEFGPGGQPFKARVVVYGTYDDIFKKVGGAWKIASRRATMINVNVTRVEQ
jgi:ketosteroid isomerase-like protein